jgi:hypothetical protein
VGRFTGWIRAVIAGLAAAVLFAILLGPVGLRPGGKGIVASVELAPWLPNPVQGAWLISPDSEAKVATATALQRFREGHHDFARISLTNHSRQTAEDVAVEFRQIPAPTVLLLTPNTQVNINPVQTNRLIVPNIPFGETVVLAAWSAAGPGKGFRPDTIAGISSLGTFQVSISGCCSGSSQNETGWDVFTSGWFPKLSILLGLTMLAVLAAGFVFWRKYAAALLDDPEYCARERHRRRVNAQFVARLPADDPMARNRGRS